MRQCPGAVLKSRRAETPAIIFVCYPTLQFSFFATELLLLYSSSAELPLRKAFEDPYPQGARDV